jgi:ankyrin repeat protein
MHRLKLFGDKKGVPASTSNTSNPNIDKYLAVEPSISSEAEVLSYRSICIDYTERQERLLNGAEVGNIDEIIICLENGADIESRSPQFGYTLLITVAERGYEPIVTFLLDKGAHINALSKNGWTALAVAANQGHLPVITTLLAKNADVALANNEGSTALYLAASRGHPLCLAILLANKADANIATDDGNTAIMGAVRSGNEVMLEHHLILLFKAHLSYTFILVKDSL